MNDGMLVVCGQRDFGQQLLNILSTAATGNHSIATSGAEARRKTGMSDYDAVLIAGKLPDENYLELAAELAENGRKGILIVVDRNMLFDAHEMLDGTGTVILVKPVTKDALLQSVKLIVRVKEGGGTLDKAKLMLMQLKNYSEPQAHRYIQKISMDKRLPRDVTAQLIIKSLEKEVMNNSF